MSKKIVVLVQTRGYPAKFLRCKADKWVWTDHRHLATEFPASDKAKEAGKKMVGKDNTEKLWFALAVSARQEEAHEA